MRDLDLWRRLRDRVVTPDELRTLASWTLARRGPYLGGIAALVEHDDPAMRAGAVLALSGARGYPGVVAIVRRLDDADEGVRAAAVAALAATARDAPARYAHAVFHPRAEVRLAALGAHQTP